MPRDGTMPEEDRALIRARQILGRQTSWQQGSWSTCLYAAMRKEGIVRRRDDWASKSGQVSRHLGISMDEAGHLIGLASVPSKCAVLDEALARRGLSVPPSPGWRGVPCWVGDAGAAAGLLAFSVATACAAAFLLFSLAPHFW